MIVVLDTGVLGLLAHPQPNREVANWVTGLIQRGRKLIVPEVCDYELRREFVRAGLKRSLDVLDQLPVDFCEYLPLTTAAMREAASIWAAARKQGLATAHDASLDADCVLAGQATTLADTEARAVVIATTNVAHLARLAPAQSWESIS